MNYSRRSSFFPNLAQNFWPISVNNPQAKNVLRIPAIWDFHPVPRPSLLPISLVKNNFGTKLLTSGTTSSAKVLGLGIAVSFVSAHLVSKAFLSFLAKHDLKVFAYYRVIVGLVFWMLLL